MKGKSLRLDFVGQHFSFCPRNISFKSGVKPVLLSTIKFLLLPRRASLAGRASSAVFQGFCAPPRRRASFPSLCKVEFPDGNHNYKHMLLLSATTRLASFSFKGKKKSHFRNTFSVEGQFLWTEK